MIAEALLLSIGVAIAAGLIGCFVVMRRMALAADALSHVALPGIGVALALHVNPVFGASAMLFFGALLVWALESRARVGTETIIGIVFSAALAVGSMMASGEDLVDALFGAVGVLRWPEIIFVLAVASAVVAFVMTHRHSLIVMLVSPDVARTAGVNVNRLNLLYLQMFALTIALGLRYLGVLLMGGLDHHSGRDRQAVCPEPRSNAGDRCACGGYRDRVRNVARGVAPSRDRTADCDGRGLVLSSELGVRQAPLALAPATSGCSATTHLLYRLVFHGLVN